MRHFLANFLQHPVRAAGREEWCCSNLWTGSLRWRKPDNRALSGATGGGNTCPEAERHLHQRSHRRGPRADGAQEGPVTPRPRHLSSFHGRAQCRLLRMRRGWLSRPWKLSGCFQLLDSESACFLMCCGGRMGPCPSFLCLSYGRVAMGVTRRGDGKQRDQENGTPCFLPGTRTYAGCVPRTMKEIPPGISRGNHAP